MERDYGGCIEDIHSELPLSHQLEPKGFKEAKMWVPETYVKLEPVSTTGIKVQQAFIQTVVYF